MKANPNGNGNGSGTLPSGPPLAVDWQRKAARGIRAHFVSYSACRAARVARGTYYKYLHTDPGFKEMIDDAYAAAKDRLQSSAYERAVNGTKVVREFYDKTGRVSSAVETTNYETQLTIKMLESHIPETFAAWCLKTSLTSTTCVSYIRDGSGIFASSNKLQNTLNIGC